MLRAKTLVLVISLAIAAGPVFGQAAPAPAVSPADKSAAYYNFSMGHLYAELASAYGARGEYLKKAIEHYRQALKLDPSATYLLEELTDLYVQSNNLRDAVTEAEDILKQDPNNLAARRMLGRIYTRLIGDTRQNAINEDMLRRSIEQYTAVVKGDPDDIDSWLTLGRLYRVSRNSVEARKAFEAALKLEPDNEDALTGLAMVYSDVGDTKGMVDALDQVAKKSPSLRTLTQLASAYEQMRDFKSAAEVLSKALKLNPDNDQVKRALAQSLLYSDQYAEALPLFQELAAAEPKDAQLQLRLAEIYRQKRDFAKAREALAKAKELDQNSVEIRYDEVNLLEAEGKTDEAIVALQKLLTDSAKKEYAGPEKANRAMLVERLGLLYRSTKQYQKAVDEFRKIPELLPEAGPRAAVQVIDTWRNAKDYQKAEAESKAAMAKFPDDRMVKVVHATLLADLGRVDEGAQVVRKLLGGDNDREVWISLAQIYEKGKNYKEMAKSIDQAEKLSKSPEEVEAVRFMRGAMYEKIKDFDAAEAEFRKVLSSSPDNAGALNYLGYMLADRNVRLEEAKKLIVRALELDPDNGAYLDSLGWVYFRLNQLEDAERYLRQSLEQMSGDPTVHDHLGDVYMQQGKLKDAISQWQLSLREWENSSRAESDPVEIAKVSKKLEGARVRLARESSGNNQRQE